LNESATFLPNRALQNQDVVGYLIAPMHSQHLLDQITQPTSKATLAGICLAIFLGGLSKYSPNCILDIQQTKAHNVAMIFQGSHATPIFGITKLPKQHSTLALNETQNEIGTLLPTPSVHFEDIWRRFFT
jgi:hypothetical protein